MNDTPHKSPSDDSAELKRLRQEVAALQAERDQCRREAECLRQVLESIPEYVLTLDRDLRFNYVNHTTDDYPPNLIGMPLLDTVAPEDHDHICSQLARVFEQGEEVVCEATGSLDGRIYESRFKPIYQDGQVVLAVANSRDVTELRRQQREQEKAEARWQLILHQVPLILWTNDRDMRFTSSIGSRLKDLGLEPGEVVGKTLYEYFGTDDPQFPAIAAVASALNGAPSSFDITWSGLDFECHVVPLRSSGGEIIGAVGIALDVTEHKRLEADLTRQRDLLEERVAERTQELAAINEQLKQDIDRRELVEAQLRESEERFRTMAEGNPVPVVISDPETGRVLYGNHRLAEMFRTPYETLKQQTTLDFYLYPEQRAELVAGMRAEGFTTGKEIELKRADGQILWAAVYHRNIQFDGRQALLACFLETTAWKAAEEALQKDQLLLRRLLELNERDRQLIAYEIHDGVVQDMSGAMMFLDAAVHTLRAEGREIDELAKSSQLLRGGIDEARRIIDGLRPPVLDEAGVIAAVENLIAEIDELGLMEVNFAHQVQFDRLAPPIEMAIYRIVQEAINNAQQHSAASSVTVNIVQEGDSIQLSIRDDGRGFDPSTTKKRRYGLQGIHERARLLGGSAEIDTAPGRGTEIRAKLPIADSLLPPFPE